MPTLEADVARRDSADDKVVLGVLDVIERDPSATQRSIARELGIALGLANTYLKRCVRKGLIKVGQVPRRRYAYFLTPQGFAEKSRLTGQYLAASFSLFRTARAQCSELFSVALARGQHRLALLGDGDLAEIAALVAREHDIDIAAILPWTGTAEQLLSDVAALGGVDAIMVTAGSAEILAAAHSVFRIERVYVPDLLRFRGTSVRSGESA